MLRPSRSVLTVLLLAASTLLLSACQSKSPEEMVNEVRSRTRVQLNAFYPVLPEDQPMADVTGDESAEGEPDQGAPDDAADAGADAPDADASEGEGGDEGTDADMAEPAEPETQTIFFDLIVLYDGKGEALPGYTVEISQADADGNEKTTWRRYIETPNLTKGTTGQVSFEEEGVLFEEGDQFAVSLRKFVPPEEQGDYREFADAASGG